MDLNIEHSIFGQCGDDLSPQTFGVCGRDMIQDGGGHDCRNRSGRHFYLSDVGNLRGHAVGHASRCSTLTDSGQHSHTQVDRRDAKTGRRQGYGLATGTGAQIERPSTNANLSQV